MEWLFGIKVVRYYDSVSFYFFIFLKNNLQDSFLSFCTITSLTEGTNSLKAHESFNLTCTGTEYLFFKEKELASRDTGNTSEQLSS